MKSKKLYEQGNYDECLEELYDLPICKKFKPIQSPSGSTSLINPSGASEGVGQDRESPKVATEDTHPDTSNNSTLETGEKE